MGRSPSNSQSDGLKRGPWTPEEDQKLIDYIQKHGQGNWQLLPRKAGLKRCGKSCRLRWTNYLRPDIKRGNFTPQEEQTIIHLHSALGNRWSAIAARLPGRTDNEIKNFWNTHLRKKLLRSGIDPRTHQLITDLSFPLNLPPVNSPMNPLENFAKIRLLSQILHVLNSNLFSSFLSGAETLNQFDCHVSGPLTPLQVPALVPNLESMNTHGHFPPVLDDSGMIGSTSDGIEEYSLRRLVQATPEISSGNQVHSVNQVENQDYDQLFVDSGACGGWGTAVDDEAGGSLWKDILDESFLASSL